jgi:hypothetical protein
MTSLNKLEREGLDELFIGFQSEKRGLVSIILNFIKLFKIIK